MGMGYEIRRQWSCLHAFLRFSEETRAASFRYLDEMGLAWPPERTWADIDRHAQEMRTKWLKRYFARLEKGGNEP